MMEQSGTGAEPTVTELDASPRLAVKLNRNLCLIDLFGGDLFGGPVDLVAIGLYTELASTGANTDGHEIFVVGNDRRENGLQVTPVLLANHCRRIDCNCFALSIACASLQRCGIGNYPEPLGAKDQADAHAHQCDGKPKGCEAYS